MYKSDNMVKKSVYVDSNPYEQAKEYLSKRGVSVVRWFEMRLKLLLGGKDETVTKFAVGGAIALGIIGASFWGYGEVTKKTCGSFLNWQTSQTYFVNHPKEARDPDRDGVFCESKIRTSDKEEVKKYRK